MTRALLLTLLMLAPPVGAQIALPRVPLPGLPGGTGGLPELPIGPQQALGALADDVGRLEDVRRDGIRLLMRRHSDVLEADPSGDPIVRGELLAFSPSDAALARAVGGGFLLLRERSLGSLGIRIAVLRAPRRMATSRALSLLRRLDPGGTYDFNNIYTQSGAAGDTRAPPSAAGAAGGAAGVALGLIDGGVAKTHPVFQGAVIHQHGCGGAAIPSPHGTEVASLMVGRSARFGGAAPGATLYAADVYCGEPAGGAVDAIAEALEWLAAARVPVINISLVGPANALLQQVIARAVAQGFLIVAAVGNDGPAAPPLYPAGYPGVVGVTAVDARRKVIFEAERGPQVMFAAPGADIPAASVSGGYITVRGTSFAAPLVAGILAARLKSIAATQVPALSPSPSLWPSPGPAAAHAAVAALARDAIHLGSPGRNAVFGYGLVGADLPSRRAAAGE